METALALDDGFTLSNLSFWSLAKRMMAHPDEAKGMDLMECLQMADFRHMNRLRKRIDDTVKDKAKAEILKPCGFSRYLSSFFGC